MTIPAALSLLQVLIDRKKVYDTINRQLRSLDDESDPPRVQMIDPKLEMAVVTLLDVILDDDLASYFLWDRPKDGGAIYVDGKEWPLRSVEDIRRYIEGRP